MLKKPLSYFCMIGGTAAFFVKKQPIDFGPFCTNSSSTPCACDGNFTAGQCQAAFDIGLQCTQSSGPNLVCHPNKNCNGAEPTYSFMNSTEYARSLQPCPNNEGVPSVGGDSVVMPPAEATNPCQTCLSIHCGNVAVQNSVPAKDAMSLLQQLCQCFDGPSAQCHVRNYQQFTMYPAVQSLASQAWHFRVKNMANAVQQNFFNRARVCPATDSVVTITTESWMGNHFRSESPRLLHPKVRHPRSVTPMMTLPADMKNIMDEFGQNALEPSREFQEQPAFELMSKVREFQQETTLERLTTIASHYCVQKIADANADLYPETYCDRAMVLCWNKAANLRDAVVCFKEQLDLPIDNINACDGKPLGSTCSSFTFMMNPLILRGGMMRRGSEPLIVRGNMDGTCVELGYDMDSTRLTCQPGYYMSDVSGSANGMGCIQPWDQARMENSNEPGMNSREDAQPNHEPDNMSYTADGARGTALNTVEN